MSLWFDFNIVTTNTPKKIVESIFAGIDLEGVAQQTLQTGKFYMQTNGLLATADYQSLAVLNLKNISVQVTYHVLEAELSPENHHRIIESALTYLNTTREDAILTFWDEEVIVYQHNGMTFINQDSGYWQPEFKQWLQLPYQYRHFPKLMSENTA